MKTDPSYTLYHPRWYRRPVSVWWWTKRWCYTKFVLRELTSVFVAIAAFVYLWHFRALLNGPEFYAAFCEKMRTLPMLVLHAVTLAATVFHTVTWFHLAPRATVLRVGGKKLPDAVLVGLNYCLWIVASCAVAWALLRG